MALILYAILLAFVIELVLWFGDQKSNIYLFGKEVWNNLVRTIASYLGIYLEATPPKSETVQNFHQIVSFTILLLGLVIFASYNASLTSELSAINFKKPFTTPSQIAESQFSVATLCS